MYTQFSDGSSGLPFLVDIWLAFWETKAPQLDVRLTDGQARKRWNKKPVGIQHVKLSLVERKKNGSKSLLIIPQEKHWSFLVSKSFWEIFWGCPAAFDCSCQVREMMDEDRGSSLKSLDTRVGVGNGSWVWRNMDFQSHNKSKWCSLYVVVTYYKTHQCGRCAQAPRYPWNSEVEHGWTRDFWLVDLEGQWHLEGTTTSLQLGVVHYFFKYFFERNLHL